MPEQESNLILVIDDDSAVTALLELLLQSNGFHTMTCNSGAKGIELARQHKPGVIICDLRMPPPDGFEICRTLLSDDETRHIPIIIVSALNDDNVVLAALDSGASAYLTKPCPSRKLIECIKKVQREKRLGLYDV